MNILKRAWQWLTTKHQKESTVTDQVVEIQAETNETVVEPVVAEAAPVAPAAAEVSPADEVKAGVHDFEEAFKFVADGVAKLGEGAKDELIALAKKYL